MFVFAKQYFPLVQVQQGEPKRRAGQKTCFFFLPFFSLSALPQRFMYVRLHWRTLICIEADRRQWRMQGGGDGAKQGARGRAPEPDRFATMFWFVWSLQDDVCCLIVLFKLNYIVGSSPTRRAKTKGHPKGCPFCFGFIYSIWTANLRSPPRGGC